MVLRRHRQLSLVQRTEGIRMHQFRAVRLLFGLATAILIAGCGGGGGGGGGVGGTPAPDGLSYPLAPAFVVGQTISALAPTVTGTVTTYSVSPQLPAGLSLSASTGAISGTPTAVTSAARYTVEASNSGGSTTATITLTVNDALPAISYGGSNFTLTKQGPVHLTPTNSGGSVVTWSISGDLPAGLTFSTTDGSISGTPIAAAAAASYVVTAQNSGGQINVNLTLQVQSVLLNLGNSGGIDRIRLGNSRVLSLSGDSWVLWDAGTAASLASGAADCLVPPSHLDPACHTEPLADIAGSIVIIEVSGALEIRSSLDGSLIATLTVPTGITWWRLAADGSYVSAGGPSGLTVWSPTGTVVLSRTGDYSGAIVFAAPGALRVGGGPAGTSVIETLSLPSGSSSIGPAFQGQFNSWFQDGSQFLTNVGNTVWVYSADGTQEDIRALPTIAGLTGQGSWFWTYDGGITLTVYKVGASGSPAGTFTVGFLNYTSPTPSAMTIGALEEAVVGSPPSVAGVVHIIDLSGTSPVMVDHTTPAFDNTAYAATSSSQWLVGNADGTLLDGASLGGTLRYFGYGSGEDSVFQCGDRRIGRHCRLAQHGRLPRRADRAVSRWQCAGRREHGGLRSGAGLLVTGRHADLQLASSEFPVICAVRFGNRFGSDFRELPRGQLYREPAGYRHYRWGGNLVRYHPSATHPALTRRHLDRGLVNLTGRNNDEHLSQRSAHQRGAGLGGLLARQYPPAGAEQWRRLWRCLRQ